MIFESEKYCVYVSIRIDFLSFKKDLEENVNKYNRLLFSVNDILGLETTHDFISLYEGYMANKNINGFNPYYLNASFLINDLGYLELQFLERTITNIIGYWNYNIFRFNGKSCTYSIEIEKNKKTS